MTVRHQTASACIIDPATGMVLLVWHRAYRCWVLPGGHLETGESPAEAALREVQEETGVQADPASVRFVESAVYPAPAKPARPSKPAEDAHEHEDLLFAAVADSTLPVTVAEDEVARVCWQPISRLGDLPVRSEVLRVVALAWQLIGGAQ